MSVAAGRHLPCRDVRGRRGRALPEDGRRPGAEPGLYECLACFVSRRVEAVGCDRTRLWTQWFRDLKSPTATALEGRLLRIGVLRLRPDPNGYRMVAALLVRDLMTDELSHPDELPDCAGVRRTSTKPCANWERQPLSEWQPGRHAGTSYDRGSSGLSSADPEPAPPPPNQLP